MKRTTIADIARKLQVSMHTVNKALYGKKGVGEALREKILETAKEMNYRVNRVAQSMARKPIVIGVLQRSSDWPMIIQAFTDGITTAIDQLRDYNVEGRYYTYAAPEQRADAVRRAIQDAVSVIIFLHSVPTDQETAMLAEASIPLALLGTEGAENSRLTNVRADSLMAGRLVAELFAMALPPDAAIAAFTGSPSYRDHADKITGFTEELKARGRRLAGVYEHFDKPDLAEMRTDQAFEENPNLDALYIATGNCVAICRRSLAHGHRPLIVATDLYDDIRNLMRQGVIAATIYQNAPQQAQKLIELLYGHFCENQPIPQQVLIPPAIILPANCDIF